MAHFWAVLGQPVGSTRSVPMATWATDADILVSIPFNLTEALNPRARTALPLLVTMTIGNQGSFLKGGIWLDFFYYYFSFCKLSNWSKKGHNPNCSAPSVAGHFKYVVSECDSQTLTIQVNMNSFFASWVPVTCLGSREKFKKCQLAEEHPTNRNKGVTRLEQKIKQRASLLELPPKGGGSVSSMAYLRGKQRPFCLSSPATSAIEINHFLRSLCVFLLFSGVPPRTLSAFVSHS